MADEYLNLPLRLGVFLTFACKAIPDTPAQGPTALSPLYLWWLRRKAAEQEMSLRKHPDPARQPMDCPWTDRQTDILLSQACCYLTHPTLTCFPFSSSLSHSPPLIKLWILDFLAGPS